MGRIGLCGLVRRAVIGSLSLLLTTGRCCSAFQPASRLIGSQHRRPPAHTGLARSHEVDIVNEPITLHIDVSGG